MTEKEILELRFLIRAAMARDRSEVKEMFGLSACAGKDSFNSFDQARTKIAWHKRGLVQPYRCETCGRWHLGGSRSGRERRAILQRPRRRIL